MLSVFGNANFVEKQESDDIEQCDLREDKSVVTNKSPTHETCYDYIHSTINQIATDMSKDSIKKVLGSLNLSMRLSYNKNICKEIENYFVMDISSTFDGSIYGIIGVLARNLIPDIIRIRREVGYFKLKLVDARRSKKDHDMVNYRFVSVDYHDNENDKVVFERYDTEKVKIIINH